jgi:murein DD-endopeptidase MepM/ murein hydrolase activator NlpD
MRNAVLMLFVALIASLPAQAADFKLTWPVACTLGTDCWFMNYVDIDPASGKAIDAQCSNRTYDTHNGVDIAIADEAGMKKGYAVLAAADGTVSRLRDGEEDAMKATADDIARTKESKRECGNGILVEHPGGYKTQYCHVKNGSIIVKPGDKVVAGQPMAEIGLSGVTQQPHLHISLTGPDDKPIDPFKGVLKDGACMPPTGSYPESYWADSKIAYSKADIIAMGLVSAKPDYAAVLAGTQAPGKNGEPNSILYVVGMGTKAGDNWQLSLTAPDGEILVSETISQKQDKARQFYFAGRSKPIQAGTYKADVRLTRNGAEIARKAASIVIP